MKKSNLLISLLFLFSSSHNSFAQNWNQIIKTVSSTRTIKSSTARSGFDNFGNAVAIDGDYAVIGAVNEDHDENGGIGLTNSGSVTIYKRNAGLWSHLKKIVSSDRANADLFGISVSISGDFIVVGAYQEDEDAAGGNTLNNAGSVYIFYRNQGGADNWGQVKKIVASDRAANDYFGFSVAISGDNIIVGAYQEDEDAGGLNTAFEAGSAYIFNKDQGGVDNWGQVQKIVASDRQTADYFGFSVSISGEIATVGAVWEDEDAGGINTLTNAGSTYIFYKNQGGANNWGQVKKIVATDRGAQDQFGHSVSVSGNTIAVGAYLEDEDAGGANTMIESGSAYIFGKDVGGADNWGQVKKIVSDVRNPGDYFGYSIAIDGSNVVVGCTQEDFDATETNNLVNAGAAYVFGKDVGGVDNWGQVRKIVNNDRDIQDFFGNAVAISDTTILVGVEDEDEDVNDNNTVSSAGSAYLFYKDLGGTGNWGQQQKIVLLDRVVSQNYGWSVDVDGDYAVVGSIADFSDAIGDNHLMQAGSAYVLKNINGVWTEIKKIVASDRSAADQFGESVSISGNIIVVGASHEDEDAAGANTLALAGSAYIYYKDQGGVDNWGQLKKIVPSDRDAGDSFGTSVSIDGTILFVGASDEDEDASGGNTLTNAGSAYVFYKDQGGVDNWGELKKIVSSDRGASDNFGSRVLVSGDIIVAGAPNEDEDAAGANTFSNAGSAYVFYKNQGGVDNWGQVRKIVSADRAVGDVFGTSISVNGGVLVVGAPAEDEDAAGGNTLLSAGSAYLFYKDQGGADNWGQVRKIVASDRGPGDLFGGSVSIFDTVLAVNARFEDEDSNGANPLTNSGSVYIFYKDQGGVDNWGQVRKIVAADRAVAAVFGLSLALNNGNLIIGAPGESLNAIGGSPIGAAGAAYFFKDCISPGLATAFTSVVTYQPANTQIYYDNNCNLIATVESGGAYTVVGQTTAKVWIEAVQPSAPYEQFVKRHYEITPDNNAAAATGKITLYFTQAEFDDFNAVSNVDLPTAPLDLSGIGNMLVEQRGGRSSDGSGLPNTYPGTVTTINPVDATDIIWNATDMRWEVSFDVTGFSGFFLKTFSFPLPIKWLQLNAKLNNQNRALLNWVVEEQFTANYIVEKSIDGVRYHAIASVNSKGDGTNSYNFVEAVALAGTGFYRIKQVQKGGQFLFSSVMKLSTFANADVAIFPNPVKDMLTITAGNDLLNTKAWLNDMSGKAIVVIPVTGNSFTVDLSRFARGIYMLKFENGISKKIVKQ